MKKKKVGLILELAAEGLGRDAIAREAKVTRLSVDKVLSGVVPKKVTTVQRAQEPDQIIIRPKKIDIVEVEELPLQEMIAIAKLKTKTSLLNANRFIERMEEVIGEVLQEPALSIPPHALQGFAMVWGILTSKRQELLRHLRDLEAEAGDDIDVGWNVVVVDDDDDDTTG